MKFIIVLVAILAGVSAQLRYNQVTARPVIPARPIRPTSALPVRTNNDQAAGVLRYDNDASPDGTFNYAIELENGISAQAQGTPRDFGGNPPVVADVIQGSFSWTSPEGENIVVTYIADENGYQPSSNAIPTPPPIPEAIQKALAQINRN